MFKITVFHDNNQFRMRLLDHESSTVETVHMVDMSTIPFQQAMGMLGNIPKRELANFYKRMKNRKFQDSKYKLGYVNSVLFYMCENYLAVLYNSKIIISDFTLDDSEWRDGKGSSRIFWRYGRILRRNQSILSTISLSG